MTDLSGDVLALVSGWLPDDDEPERPQLQLQLATVDADGRPDVRTVLLSAWDATGFVFHTDAASRKAAQLAAHPAVALAIVWPARQLVIRGLAEPASAERIELGFRRRSPYLRQLAWQNTHELAQLDRDERVRRWRAFQAEHDVAVLPISPTWTGYLVRPDRLTFWESDPDGPSHRLEYEPDADGWRLTHLAG